MKQLHVVQISESDFTVQGHGVHTAFIETISGLQQRKDVIVSKNNFSDADIRHIHTIGMYALSQLLFGRGKKIVSAHVVPESFIGSLKGAKYWLWAAKIYLRWFYNRADVVIAVSDQTKQGLRRLGVKSRVEVVHNMIDIQYYNHTENERQELRKKFGFTSTDTIVVSNGQVQPRKRVDTFLRVARDLPDMKFIWVGGMPFGKVAADAAEMRNLMQKAPKNVQFTGLVPREMVREYFVIGDIFFMPSEQETFGLSIVEAAASGMPLVLRDIADYHTTFKGGAMMCDENTFVESITALLANKTLHEKMIKQSSAIAKRYDSAAITDRLIAIYRSCL